MGNLVYVLGRTGTGKSYSLRNFPQDQFALVNVVGKILPFRGSAKIEQTTTDDSDQILKAIEIYSKKYKSIVIDDFQYVMSNEFMRRATERGFDKFTEIAAHAWNIADKVRELPSDVNVYILCHTDVDQEGTERLKTIGKLLDEKIYLEGMSTIVLKTVVSDGKYSFVTQNNGKDTVKSPADMFPSYAIDNDLYYVDQKIREYYGFDGATMSAEDLAKADETAAKTEIEKPVKKRRSRSSDPTPEPTESTEAEVTEPVESNEPTETTETPRRKRRNAAPSEPVESESTETTEATENNDEPTEPVDAPESTEEPRRRRRRRI